LPPHRHRALKEELERIRNSQHLQVHTG
jgi:hypothetical protein